ncbi:MAG: 3-hydroxybutyryl-CoA dehydrogenase [Flavobacteriales bacterium]|nr:3-hydroxybutyryl-CoA dehydrogenase [Flavobacteriales bacterium]MBP9080514.1 3-hydroxybutyryl-CoA dehydrogenase [Flavobacteriales bacterium]
MNEQTTVGIIGAGTMGVGIAQVAAQAGHHVLLFDTRQEAVSTGLNGLRSTLDKLVAKDKLKAAEAGTIMARITAAQGLNDLAPCGLIIEAIVENLQVKKDLFAALETVVHADAVLASNTSSLSITAIAAGCTRPERVIGLHFFNPAPLMPLVEVVPGLVTATGLPHALHGLMLHWGKSPVVCKDTPGFIVNRVARPFYGESLRLYEEGVADMATIDQALKNEGGFRMGPFELMDLIGNDINFAVTRSVWQAFFHDPRYKPSLTQQRQVESGRLGRKTGRGYFNYAEGPPSTPVQVQPELAGQITERVVAMLINEAADALFLQVASKEDLDLAMRKGVNYPKGLLAWADEQGAAHWTNVLDNLYRDYGEDRYRASPLLRRMARVRGSFF